MGSNKKAVFITGATGYIGGSLLSKITRAGTFPSPGSPELEITALLRSPNEAFTSRYPAVKVIRGDFDDFSVIEQASRDADVVIHTGDIDHAGCARAILAGVAKRRAAGLETFVVHLTGTGCITDALTNPWRGEANPKIWDDVRDVEEIYNLPDEAFHHVIDRSFQDASDGELTKVVCIAPPDIYGQSSAVGSARATFLVPMYVAALIKHKQAFYMGKGENMKAVTHISDVVDMFVLVLSKYFEGGSELQYGKEGFYFAVADEVRWKDAAEAINRIGKEQGWLPAGAPTVSWSKEQVASETPWRPIVGLYLWGANSRVVSTRARRLGWKPKSPSFWDALAEDCRVAADSYLKKLTAKDEQGKM